MNTGIMPFNTRIINNKLSISNFEIARLFGINATVVANALNDFSAQAGQSDAVYIEHSDLLPPTHFAFAPAFRAFAAAFLANATFDQTQVYNVIMALELKLSAVGQVA